MVIMVGSACPYAIVAESSATDSSALNFIIVIKKHTYPLPWQNREEGGWFTVCFIPGGNSWELRW